MSKPRVLVIEDDESLAELITHVLQTEGYEVQSVPDGVQGMSLARQWNPALMVLDFMLPAGGGAPVHKALRALETTRDIPILLLTAVQESIVTAKIDMDARTYFLGKPYRKSELLELIGQILLDNPKAPYART